MVTKASHKPAKWWGLERKDIFTIAISLLALSVSSWTASDQYFSKRLLKARQERQVLYAAARIGEFLAISFDHSHMSKEETPVDREFKAVLSVQLSAINIHMRPEDIRFIYENDYPKLPAGYEIANSFPAFVDTTDAISITYSDDVADVMKASYYLDLALHAANRVEDEAKSKTMTAEGCAVWKKHGPTALKDIQGTYALRPIDPERCEGRLVYDFRSDLEYNLNALTLAFKDRLPLAIPASSP